MPEHKPLKLHAAYLARAVEEPEQIAADARCVLWDQRLELGLKPVEFDTLVGQGLSGALVIPALARALGKHWMIIRKDGDGSHSGGCAEGTLGERWLFVDDLIDTGGTRDRCISEVTQLAERHDRVVTFTGSFLYHGYASYRPPTPAEKRKSHCRKPGSAT